MVTLLNLREKRKVITFLHIKTTTIGFNRFSYLLEIELLLTLLTSMGNPIDIENCEPKT